MFFNTIIFDLDNTLYDYDICNKKALNKVSEFIKIDIGKFLLIYKEITNKYKLETGNTAASHNRFNYFKWIKEYLKLDYSVTDMNNLYWETYIDNMLLFNGVLDLLKFLKKNEIKIGLLTDFQTEYQYRKLEKLGILEYFDVIVTSEEIGIEKPSEKGFQYILKKLGASTDKTIMIGDSIERDIKGSNNVGMYSMLFSKSYTHDHKVDFDFDSQNKMGIFSSYVDLLKSFEWIKKDLNTLKWLSQDLGQRFDLTQAAGGNISIKNDHFMIIKSSGVNLYDVTENNGYSFIKNDGMKYDVSLGIYKDTSEYNVILDKKASMETYMHSYLKKYTIHLHPIEINKVLVRKDAKDIIYNKILPKIRFRPEYVPFIEYVKPGVDLSKKIYENINKEVLVDHLIFLKNHGLILSGGSLLSLLSHLKDIIKAFEEYNNTVDPYKYKNTSIISAAMNIFYKEKEDYVTYLIEDEIINKNINSIDFGSTFPDKVVYCGIDILKYDGDLTNLKEVDLRLKLFNLKFKPIIFLLGKYMYITAKSMQRCREIESVLKAHFIIKNDNVNYLSIENELDLLNMEEEKYRQNVYSTQN